MDGSETFLQHENIKHYKGTTHQEGAHSKTITHETRAGQNSREIRLYNTNRLRNN